MSLYHSVTRERVNATTEYPIPLCACVCVGAIRVWVHRWRHENLLRDTRETQNANTLFPISTPLPQKKKKGKCSRVSYFSDGSPRRFLNTVKHKSHDKHETCTSVRYVLDETRYFFFHEQINFKGKIFPTKIFRTVGVLRTLRMIRRKVGDWPEMVLYWKFFIFREISIVSKVTIIKRNLPIKNYRCKNVYRGFYIGIFLFSICF